MQDFSLLETGVILQIRSTVILYMHLVLFEYLLRLFLYLLGVFSRPYIKIGDRELPTNLSLSYQNKKNETVDLRHLVSG